MLEHKKITVLIFDVIKEINQIQPKDKRIELSMNTVLYGNNSKLDSFGLVSLIVGIEEKLQDITGKSIVLADEKAFSRERSPFLTVSSLADYVSELINEN